MAFHGGIKFKNNIKLNKSCVSFKFNPVCIKMDISGMEPIVQQGQVLVAGEPLAKRSDGFVRYASVGGTVDSVDDCMVCIKSDGASDEFVNMPLFEYSLKNENREKMLEYLMTSGITCNGYPLATAIEKYRSSNNPRLLINCIETEPQASAAYRTIAETPAEVVGGAKILLLLLGIRTGVFAIEKRKKRLAAAIEKQKYDKNMFVISLLPSKYPQQQKRLIMNEVFYTATENSVLMVDPMLCVAVYDAFVHGVPYVGKNVTVSLESWAGCNLFVPFGSGFGELYRYLCGSNDVKDDVMVCINSLLNGEVIKAEKGIFDSECSFLTFYRSSKSVKRLTESCIYCGNCREICPMELDPYMLYKSLGESSKKVLLYGIDRCIGCGCCSYACPVSIPHIVKIKEYKNKEKELKADEDQ